MTSLRFSCWTELDDAFVLQNHGKLSNEEMGRHLGRTPGAVKARLGFLGLTKQLEANWTKEEDKFLIEHYRKVPPGEIALALGRTNSALIGRVRLLQRKGLLSVEKRILKLEGNRFGRLVVTDFAESDGTKSFWICRCDCGKQVKIRGTDLTSGSTTSCGCYAADFHSARSTTHGHKRGGKESSTYSAWRSMIKRCTNPECEAWSYYGGRGIKVCESWLNFEAFLKDMGEAPKGYTIERIDVNGNYEPENCRWATQEEQGWNKTNTRYVTYNGETKSLAEWVKFLGLNYSLVTQRLQRGWSPEKAFNKPSQRK